jgi:SAF domain
MRVVARIRLELARRPWIHWCVVVALATGAAWSVAAALAGVDRARAAWGTVARVVVANQPLAPGDPLAGATQLRSVPLAVVPAGAVGELPDGAVARQRIGPDEIVTIDDVAARAGPPALAPPGTRIVAVAETVPTAAVVGDRVAVASDGVELVDGAVVVGRIDGAVLLAVDAGRAAGVAAAAVAPAGVALLIVP